jgi:hypothetical protein
MNAIEFEEFLQETYNNLTREQFDHLVQSAKEKIKEYYDAGIIRAEKEDDGTFFFDSDNEYLKTGANVFIKVEHTRKITYKQFKALSAFSKVNWINYDDKSAPYKQF